MFCNNCGKELKENAKFCDNCGKSIQTNNKMGKIYFKRIGRYVGCLIDFDIYIDGKIVGSLPNNGTLEVPVSIGEHRVMFDLWSGSNAETINVTAEYPNVYVDVKLTMGVITNKPKIVNIRSEK